MSKSLAIRGLLAAGAAALTLPAAAITGTSWVDDNEHPFVGLIVFYDAAGEFVQRCSGSLISPTKFLTAGHCTDATAGVVSARVYFQQNAGANYDPATQLDPVSGYPETCAPARSASPARLRRGSTTTASRISPAFRTRRTSGS